METTTKWYEVEEARDLAGVRLVLTEGVPNPWAEAAKAVYEVKKIPFSRVLQRVMGGNEALQEWTGQTSAPVAVLDAERPRTTWSEMLLLAERLRPDPPLLPAEPEERALALGLLHEIAGEMGFGWCRRMNFAHAVLSDPSSPLRAVAEYIAGRYGYAWADQEQVRRRIVALLDMFAKRLHCQHREGSRYFVGRYLTAVDLYWSAFAALVEPLPQDLCPMHPVSRKLYTLVDPTLRSQVDPVLLEHRDWIYREHLTLPVQLRQS